MPAGAERITEIGSSIRSSSVIASPGPSLIGRGSAAKLVSNFEIYSPGEDPVTRRKNTERIQKTEKRLY